MRLPGRAFTLACAAAGLAAAQAVSAPGQFLLGASPGSTSGTFPLIGQQTYQWCSAAVTQMVTTYFGSPVSQCDVMNTALMRTDCCTARRNCAQKIWPPFCSENVQHQRTCRQPLSYDDVKSQINARGVPVAFSRYSEASYDNAHIWLAIGYNDDNQKITAVNPLTLTLGTAEVEEGTYQDLYVNQFHGDDFFDLATVMSNCVAPVCPAPPLRSSSPSPSTRAASGVQLKTGAQRNSGFSLMPKKPYVPVADLAPWAAPLPKVHVSDESRKRGLAELQAAITARNYALFGFKSLREAKGRLTTGLVFGRFGVTARELSSYEGGDLGRLFEKKSEWMTPVQSGRRVRSSITFVRSGSDWDVVRYGNPVSIRVLDQLRDRAAKNYHFKKSEAFVISIPGLNLTFFGVFKDGSLRAIPLADDLQSRFKRLDFLDAKSLFKMLAKDMSALGPYAQPAHVAPAQ
jgi:hypothetical protein